MFVGTSQSDYVKIIENDEEIVFISNDKSEIVSPYIFPIYSPIIPTIISPCPSSQTANTILRSENDLNDFQFDAELVEHFFTERTTV